MALEVSLALRAAFKLDEGPAKENLEFANENELKIWTDQMDYSVDGNKLLDNDLGLVVGEIRELQEDN